MGIHERKVRERDQRRSDILDSARAVFSKHGLEAFSMDRIAEEAELAKGTLYLYFKNRDELLLGLITQEFEAVVIALEKIATSKLTPDKKLQKSVTTFRQFSQTHMLFYQAITQVDMKSLVGCSGDEPDKPIHQFQCLSERIMEAMISMVEEGVSIGMFHTTRPARLIVIQLQIALKGIMIVTNNELFPPAWGKVDAGQLLQDTADLFIKGLKCHQPS